MINTSVAGGSRAPASGAVDNARHATRAIGQHLRMRQPRPVPLAIAQRPFRLNEALGLGVTPNELRGPAYRQLFRDVYVAADLPDSVELRCDGLALVLPKSVAFSHHTAASLCELPVPDEIDIHITAADPRHVPRKRPGVIPHESIGEADVWVFRGRRMTTPERTWLDLAHSLHRDDLVILGDAMLRKEITSTTALSEALTRWGRRRGVLTARTALPLLRPRVDSPMETRVRLILVDAGLPCPEPNLDIYDDWGGWIGRPDLSYKQLKIGIQYEGDHHRSSRKQWMRDIARDGTMQDHGWEIIKVTSDDVFVRQRLFVNRVAQKIAERS